MTHLPSSPEPMIFREFARAHPEPLDALGPFSERLLYGDGPLPFGERELIAAFVGRLTGCDYVRQSHRSAALAHGMDADMVDAVLEAGNPEAAGDARLAAALALVRRLVEDPAACDGAAIAGFLEAGHNEDAAIQIIYLAGYWAMIVVMVEGLGIWGDDSYHARMGPQLAREAGEIAARLREAG